jgi:hypothetical protein
VVLNEIEMGFLKNIALGALGVKTYQNVYNKPIVTPPHGYAIRGMDQKGLGAKWVVKYSKKHQMNLTHSFRISGKSTKSVSIGGDVFLVDWP